MARRPKAFDHSKYANWIDPAKVVPYERNAKVHTDKQIANIVTSIKRFGWQQDTVLTTDNVLVIGHGRRLAALRLGCEMPYHTVDKTADELTDEDIRELRIADNQTNQETGYDFETLMQEIEDLDFDGFEFDFDLPDIPEEAPDIVEDEAPAVPEEPVCKPGELYQLGEHRLLIGDATRPGDVERLMDGEQADLWLTDPPYNVNYEEKEKELLKHRPNKRVQQDQKTGIDNDKMDSAAFQGFLLLAFQCARDAMKPGAPFYIWHADSESVNFRTACELAGLPVRETLILVKNHFVLGHLDYHYRHEPCLYGWKDGPHYFTASRSQSTVIPDLTETDPAKMKKEDLVKLVTRLLSEAGPTTVIEMDKPTRSSDHPTMKPVMLFDYLIRNSSQRGDIVLDCFAGSGTTIMACEQDGRRARCLELDPKYGDVIIRRWEDFTGEKAVCLSKG